MDRESVGGSARRCLCLSFAGGLRKRCGGFKKRGGRKKGGGVKLKTGPERETKRESIAETRARLLSRRRGAHRAGRFRQAAFEDKNLGSRYSYNRSELHGARTILQAVEQQNVGYRVFFCFQLDGPLCCWTKTAATLRIPWQKQGNP